MELLDTGPNNADIDCITAWASELYAHKCITSAQRSNAIATIRYAVATQDRMLKTAVIEMLDAADDLI